MTEHSSTPAEPLSDTVCPQPVLDREVLVEGKIFTMVRDTVELDPQEDPVVRDYMQHPGAVAIAALNERDEILLINQYRQPVGMRLWEVPAGLLDVPGEEPVAAAARELWEEADLRAEQWHTLLDFQNSPGCSTEANRIFLARGLSEAPADQRHSRTEEEAGILLRWVPIEEAVDAVLGTRLHSPSANQAVLAVWASLQRGHRGLQDPRAPWPAHPERRHQDGVRAGTAGAEER